MVIRVQVPDFAGTIQKAGQGFRDQRNFNQLRQDKIAADEVDAAKLKGAEAHKRYAKLQQELRVGYTKMESIRASSPDEESANANTRELTKYLAGVTDKTDNMGLDLGLEPTMRQELNIAAQSRWGGQLSADKGSLASSEAITTARANQESGLPEVVGQNASAQSLAQEIANQSSGLPQLAGQNAGIREQSKLNELPPKTRERTKDSRGVEYYLDGTPVLQEDEARVDAAGALELADKNTKAALRASTLTTDAQNVVGAAKNAMDLISWGSTGRVGQVIALLKTDTDAQSLRLALETVEANLALTKLEQIRAASVDGSSGLGQLSDKEFSALQAAFANLSANQDPESLRRQLTVILEGYNKILGRYGEGYDESQDPRADEYWAAQEKKGNSRPGSQSQADITLNNDDDSKY